MRVKSGGTPVAFFDVDAGSGLVFPQRVADLPAPSWPPGGPNGFWIVNNRCNGNDCRLTGFIAQEYRQICAGGGGEGGEGPCTNERPFHEIYAACPAGTQSGNNIAYTVGSGGEGGDTQTLYLDEGTCYAPSPRPTDLFGYDITGAVPGYFWTVQSARPIVGFKLNPLNGPTRPSPSRTPGTISALHWRGMGAAPSPVRLGASTVQPRRTSTALPSPAPAGATRPL
jgi:conjugal transfer mating pair stabilization protein TraN